MPRHTNAKTANRINFMTKKDAEKYGFRYYIGGFCKHCKQSKTIRYTCNSVCQNCSTKGGK